MRNSVLDEELLVPKEGLSSWSGTLFLMRNTPFPLLGTPSYLFLMSFLGSGTKTRQEPKPRPGDALSL